MRTTPAFPIARPVRAACVTACMLLLLGGCVLTGQRTSVQIFAPTIEVESDPDWPEVDWQLLLVRPVADQMHDSQRILVRPDPARLQVYAGASWSDSMPEMLHSLLLRAFEDSGRIEAVARQATAMRARFALTLDVRAFEAVYDRGNVPQVDVHIHAKLIHTPSTRVVSSRTFRHQQRAAGSDIAQVVAAFQQALGEFTGELIGWTLTEGENAAPKLAEWREQRAREREEERRGPRGRSD